MPFLASSNFQELGTYLALVLFLIGLLLVFAMAMICSRLQKTTASRGLGGIGAMLTGALVEFAAVNGAFSNSPGKNVFVLLVTSIPCLISFYFILQNSAEFEAFCKTRGPKEFR